MMRQLTKEEIEIMKQMDKFSESSKEYKELQKRLITIKNEIMKDCPFKYD